MSARKPPAQGHLNVVNLPTKTQSRGYADFDKWLALGNRLARYYDEINELWIECDTPAGAQKARDALARWPREQLAADLASYLDGEAFYDRAELYDDDGHLSRSVICEQVAILLGSFPNGGPQVPKVYTPMLIEEIAAADPSAVQLEAACRRLRRNNTFLPAIGEVLKALRKAMPCRCSDFDSRNPGAADCYVVIAYRELEATAALPAEAVPA